MTFQMPKVLKPSLSASGAVRSFTNARSFWMSQQHETHIISFYMHKFFPYAFSSCRNVGTSVKRGRAPLGGWDCDATLRAWALQAESSSRGLQILSEARVFVMEIFSRRPPARARSTSSPSRSGRTLRSPHCSTLPVTRPADRSGSRLLATR
jgi:hypothetical protein